MIEVKDLEHTYRFGVTSFSKVNFTLEKGIICVYGQSESGKTSLVKVLAGLSEQTKGEYLFNGTELKNIPIRERNIAYLPEDDCFFRYRSVYANLKFFGKLRIKDKNKLNKTVSDVLKQTGSEQYLHSKIRKLPKETVTDIKFSRLLMRDAELYLFDNPFKLLNEKREEYFDKYLPLITLIAETKPVIFATDSVEETEKLNSDTLILNYGIFHQFAPFREITEEPLTAFVYNMFRENATTESGTIEENKEGLIMRTGKKAYPLERECLADENLIGKTVVVCNDKNGDIKIYDEENEKKVYSKKLSVE